MDSKNINAKIAEIHELLSKAMGKLEELRSGAAVENASNNSTLSTPVPLNVPVQAPVTTTQVHNSAPPVVVPAPAPAACPVEVAAAGAEYPYAFPNLGSAKRRLYIGSTDADWFQFLKDSRGEIFTADKRTVNFWRVGGAEFSALQPGEIYLFKVNHPKAGDRIVGGAFFQEFKSMTADEAWDAFGNRNGMADKAAFTKAVKGQMLKLRSYADKIGCIVLRSPFFLEEADYAKRPADWGSPLIAGKAYECGSGVGADLYAKVAAALAAAKQE